MLLTMPRPKWTPTDEQRQLIDAAVRAYQLHVDAQQAYVQALAEAERHAVAISALAEALGVTRKTVYRHLGHPMQ
jgi:AcrR family transcriptional regulator